MLKSLVNLAGAVWLVLASGALAASAAAPLSDSAVARYSETMIFGSESERRAALRVLAERGQSDIVASLILAMRYRRGDPGQAETFRAVTGETAEGWFEAMLWQERHPEVVPHSSYRELKLDILERIDGEFLRFLGGKRSLGKNLKIRLEEITWGGVRVDGIPSLDFPKLIGAEAAGYLLDSDLVFGVAINGDVRAYPLRIMGWHEMFNEVIGGVPVALAYCTLCGAGILFETQVEGRERPLIFGSSGLLYRSNKLMFDRSTDSLWNQFTGEPVSGPLAGMGIRLKIRPVAITTWAAWRARHPETKVLSLETGHTRDYGSGVVYREYFASPDLMFPAATAPGSALRPKDFVFGMRDFGAAKAWPLAAFGTGAVINDSLGGREVVLIGSAETRSVRAYERGARHFEAGSDAAQLKGPGGTWRIEEEALVGPAGETLPRLPGHIAYWFAWDGYLGVKSELYDPDTASP